MQRSETLEHLGRVFREVFDRNDIRLTDATTAHDVPEWDSINHINLVLSVEQTFKIKFTTKEILTFKNVGDMAAAVERKV